MSYFSDHLAWQQRVAQEFKAQSSSLDNQMYQANGQWLNYPDLVQYLKTQQKRGGGANPARSFGQQLGGILAAQGSVPAGRLLSPKGRNDYSGLAETDSQYAYAAKSKLLYPRKTPSTRSKTGSKMGARVMRAEVGPYLGENGETASQLNRKAIKRFNEEIPEGGPRSQTGRSTLSKQNLARSQVGSQVSKAKSIVSVAKSQYSTYSKQQQKMQIYQNVEQLDDLQIDQISNIISRKPRDVIENPYENVVDELGEQKEVAFADEQADVVDELPYPVLGESASQVGPSQSQLSKMSGKTYISQLQKQLDEEKYARVKLEGELEELKKISSEITSQLSQIQRQALNQ